MARVGFEVTKPRVRFLAATVRTSGPSVLNHEKEYHSAFNDLLCGKRIIIRFPVLNIFCELQYFFESICLFVSALFMSIYEDCRKLFLLFLYIYFGFENSYLRNSTVLSHPFLSNAFHFNASLRVSF